ncbi:coiled-coil domain-containing protein [Mycolicibacterium fortuitum]
MKFQSPFVPKCVAFKPVVGAIVGLTALSVVWGGAAYAESDEDRVANVNELARQAEQLSETILNAQPDLDKKRKLLSQADEKYTQDLAALDATNAQLATYQRTADKMVAAVYMGGRTDGFSAMLTAGSPTNMIDKLVVQRSLGTQISGQLQSLRRVNQEARDIEAASAKSAADAKSAVEAAVALRADLQNQQTQLRAKLAAVNTSLAMLPPAQQAMVTPPSAKAVAAVGPVGPIPTVGMGGLVPKSRVILDYIQATYPGVKSIGGVRADSLPDHPSGRALDIMIGSDMALGDAINADLKSQAARFGIDYTMWRVAAHFDHVHVTVS